LSVYYTIIDQGEGEEINPNDIISYHLTLSFLDDEVWYSTDASTAELNDIYIPAADTIGFYKPELVTFTPDGWNVPSVFDISRSVDLNIELGYRTGVGQVLEQMNLGGHARLIVPSLYAYQGATILVKQFQTSPIQLQFVIPANSVIIFDVFPVFRR